LGDYPYLTAEGTVLHCALDANKEHREKRKKPFSAFSAQSSAAGLHWACSAVKGNGVEKHAFELVGNHQECVPPVSVALDRIGLTHTC
jgi:hypothetical protein